MPFDGGKKTEDLICQISDALPSVVQHVPHTKDGAVGVFLRMVVTALDLFSGHCRGKVPSKERSCRFGNTCRKCVFMFAIHFHLHYLVKTVCV